MHLYLIKKILHEIRSIERSDAKSIPIVIVSALAEDSGIIEAEEKELITGYIQKTHTTTCIISFTTLAQTLFYFLS